MESRAARGILIGSGAVVVLGACPRTQHRRASEATRGITVGVGA